MSAAVIRKRAMSSEKPNKLEPPRKNPKMVRTNVYMARPAWAQVCRLAQATGTSASEHLRRAVDQYLASLDLTPEG